MRSLGEETAAHLAYMLGAFGCALQLSCPTSLQAIVTFLGFASHINRPQEARMCGECPVNKAKNERVSRRNQLVRRSNHENEMVQKNFFLKKSIIETGVFKTRNQENIEDDKNECTSHRVHS
jgi:hypothetical protein